MYTPQALPLIARVSALSLLLIYIGNAAMEVKCLLILKVCLCEPPEGFFDIEFAKVYLSKFTGKFIYNDVSQLQLINGGEHLIGDNSPVSTRLRLLIKTLLILDFVLVIFQ